MEQKAGHKTTEFWLNLAATAIGAVMASGQLPHDSPVTQVIGLAAVILANLGYTASRTAVKKSANRDRGNG